MRHEGVNTQKLKSVRTVMARVVVTCKPSFAAPTTRATAVIAIAAKIKSPCVMAPIGLIPQCAGVAGAGT